MHSVRSKRNTYQFPVHSLPARIQNKDSREVKIRGTNFKGLGYKYLVVLINEWLVVETCMNIRNLIKSGS